jgi:hypothetical protein
MDAPSEFTHDDPSDYSRWSGAELVRAENAAGEFLSGNHVAICRCFEQQGAVLDRLFAILKQTDLTLQQRLVCFARIAEVSEGMQVCAKGFFDLGSQPVVARVLAEVKPDNL